MCLITFFKNEGKSLAIQWLGAGASTAGTWVRSLVRELSSYKLHSVAKSREREKKETADQQCHLFLPGSLRENCWLHSLYPRGCVV